MVTNHKALCAGDLVCPRCGRRMCKNCTTQDRKGERSHAKEHKGECLVCSEMYKEDEIELYPTPPRKLGVPKRMLRLDVRAGVYVKL